MERQKVRRELLRVISALLVAIARNGFTEKGQLAILDEWIHEIADHLDEDEEEMVVEVAREALRVLRSHSFSGSILDLVEEIWFSKEEE